MKNKTHEEIAQELAEKDAKKAATVKEKEKAEVKKPMKKGRKAKTKARSPSKTPEGQRKYKAQRGFKKALRMGFDAANFGLSGADEALEKMPEDERPFESFQFSDFEVNEGSQALVDFLEEYYPGFVESAPKSAGLLLWAGAVTVPRILGLVEVRRYLKANPDAEKKPTTKKKKRTKKARKQDIDD